MSDPLVIVINPNSNAETTAHMVALAQEQHPPLRIEGRTAASGPPMITTPQALAASEPEVLRLAQDLPPDCGIVSAAFGDPALMALRARHRGPVTGIGEASFFEAGQKGRAFGIATTTPALDGAIRAAVARAGLEKQLTGVSYTQGDPVALTQDPEALFQALKAAALLEMARGAEAVIIGGGPLAQAARRLQAETELPVIAPIPAAIRQMQRLLAGR